jgi:hypothetical protein
MVNNSPRITHKSFGKQMQTLLPSITNGDYISILKIFLEQNDTKGEYDLHRSFEHSSKLPFNNTHVLQFLPPLP